MTTARVLRSLAVLIVVFAAIDPAWTRVRPRPPEIHIVVMEGSDPAAAARLERLLHADYDVTSHVHPRGARLPACPDRGGCAIVTAGPLPVRLTNAGRVLGAVLTENDAALSDVDAPVAASLNATAGVSVTRTAEATERVRLFDEGVLVGESDGDAVEWIPVADGPRRLRVMSGVTAVDVGVNVRSAPWPVVMYQPEPTWAGTFVRRAIEADRQFSLRAETRVAPGIAVSQRRDGEQARLTGAALATAGVVIVTAPDALRAGEAALLDRFVRRRGGSLIVVPDRRPTDRLRTLLPAIAAERRTAAPQSIGPLRAREWLTFVTDEHVDVVAAAGDAAVVVTRHVGRGRVVISGALDAWRYRDAGGAFTGFWTSLVADAAIAAGDTVTVTPVEPVIERGADARFDVEWRSLDPLPSVIRAEGRYQCGDREGVVRLWPGARRGRFEAIFTPPDAGPCDVHVTLNEASGVGAVRVADDVRRPGAAAAVRAAIAAHGGTLVTTGDEAQLAARIRSSFAVAPAAYEVHPMRAPWWIALVAGCLAGEWWLRRRQGLR